MIQIGDIKVHLINDATTYVDAGGAFGLVPRALFKQYIVPDENNLIPMLQVNLLIQADGKNILVDTGLGDKLDTENGLMPSVIEYGGLRKGLAKLGLTPADIDIVVDSHLHSDHCGGNTMYVDDAHSQIVPTFPNAEYLVQAREYEDARQPNERTRATYQTVNYEPVISAGQMRFLEGDTEIVPGVWGIVTPGHTPGQMSIRIERDGQSLAFLSDMATYAVHFERLGWMTAYDVEPLITLETKRDWQKWALDSNAILVFPHDPTRYIGRLTVNERGHTIIEPIDEPFVNGAPSLT